MFRRMALANGAEETISALNLVPVVDAVTRLGIDGAALLESIGTSAEELGAVNARVPASCEHALWDRIEALTNDPLIALRIAERIQVGALGAYEYLMRNSQTLRAALEQASRFERVMDDALRIAVVESEREACVRQWRQAGPPHPARGTECLFAVALRVVAEVLPGERVIELRFAHAAPAEPRVFSAQLGCAVRFDRAYDEIVFRKTALDLPMRRADPALSRVLEQHMLQTVEHLPNRPAFVQRVRAALRAGLEQGDVSLEQLARSLHLSPRTLRRRLDDHGTRYKLLLDELRRELACHYVARTAVSFDELAAKLGFGDISAFYRAFKRWTETTPAAYRAARQAR
jgi:AraC-like DNA-binding protein